MKSEQDMLATLTVANILLVLAAFGAVWVILHYLGRLLASLAQRRPRTRFVVRMVEPAVRILLWFAAMLFAISQLAPSKDTFIAALGSAAIAIGLGAQDLIKNLIGGLVIVADRPYQTGDRVTIGEAHGEIERIGLRSTKLMTPDDTLVTIPNSHILDSFSFNANAGVPECMVVTELYLPPDIDPDLAIRIGQEALSTCPYLLLRRRRSVVLQDSYSETPYLVMKLMGYVYDHRYQLGMKTDLTRRCKQEFRRLGLLEGWKEVRG
jgi:small-conductance mechanosensitive channel